jgi:predicted RNA-binding Zn-ribbon protein involved in translation (DUF1610 family)
MKRATTVRYHGRKTKRGVVPVRSHNRVLDELRSDPKWKSIDAQIKEAKKQKLLYCPNCGSGVWDVAKGSGLNKCWGCGLRFD